MYNWNYKFRNLFRSLQQLPRLPIFFVFSAFSLFILSIIQVDCPVCSSVIIEETPGDLTSLKTLETKAELIDHKITYPGCGYSYAFSTYEVTIVLINEGTELLSSAILIHGDIPDEAILAYPTWVEKNAKLINIEISGGQSKWIQESAHLWIVGLDVSKAVASQAHFSIITDPKKIKSSCYVCDGDGKIPFNQWLIEVIK